jgi:hypothetical protein
MLKQTIHNPTSINVSYYFRNNSIVANILCPTDISGQLTTSANSTPPADPSPSSGSGTSTGSSNQATAGSKLSGAQHLNALRDGSLLAAAALLLLGGAAVQL